MIEEILISKIATFGQEPESLSKLSKFNFVFGSNGTGKTTISRIIANEEKYSDSKVIWRGGTKLETMVYNRDFVDRNFDSSQELQGVFTIGENNVDVMKNLETLRSRRGELLQQKETLRIDLEGYDGQGGKLADQRHLEQEIIQQCWAKMKQYDSTFRDAFTGVRNSKEKFWERLHRQREINSAPLSPLDLLKTAAESVFDESPELEQSVEPIDTIGLLALERKEILTTVVVGKQDVDIAEMIERLGSGDWVCEGKRFYDVNDGICPFCQQPTDSEFAQSLVDYFDETYVEQVDIINKLKSRYEVETSSIQQRIDAIIQSQSKYIDAATLEEKKLRIDALVSKNMQTLDVKIKEPGRKVELDSLNSVIDEVNSHIQSANTRVDEHNRVVANLGKERGRLVSQIWRFLLEELKTELKSYDKINARLQEEIDSLRAKLGEKATQISQYDSEITQLEKQTTSIQPAIDGINSILNSFGFRNFSIARGNNNTYKLVREDGAEAQKTLSEGEKAFVTFLYFYYLIEGSQSDEGATSDRVVVFDDPVSSLDSDVHFVVSSLIKEIMEKVRDGSGQIKQAFVLTHNIYFHREVTFDRSRNYEADKRFWIARKANSLTKLTSYSENPIRTAYELLWVGKHFPKP